jgi:hypothetical protein
MKNTIILIVIFFAQNIRTQSIPPEYFTLIKKADSLLMIKEYRSSAFTYSNAFKALGWKGRSEDRYKAARAWAMSGYPDSAMFNLERIAFKTAYADIDKISNDKDLASLYTHKRWKFLLDKIKNNSDSLLAVDARRDKKLIRKLDSLSEVDQMWRNLSTRVKNGLVPKDSISPIQVALNMKRTDSLNFYEVRRIYLQHGFPNYDLVGEEGAGNFWLIVQHQDRHPTFQDSVLNSMKIEVNKGKASKKDYAYLVDRVKINTGQKQIYGTQFQLNADHTSFELQNVIERDKLNERRFSMGLGPVEEYLEYANKRYYGALKKE